MNADWLIKFLSDNIPWVIEIYKAIISPSEKIKEIEFISAIILVPMIIIGLTKLIFSNKH